MSKKHKTFDHDDATKTRHLQGELNRAKKQISQLVKENQRLRVLLEHENRPIMVREKKREHVKKMDMCPDCNEGHLVLLNLGVKNVLSCKSCGYRRVVK